MEFTINTSKNEGFLGGSHGNNQKSPAFPTGFSSAFSGTEGHSSGVPLRKSFWTIALGVSILDSWAMQWYHWPGSWTKKYATRNLWVICCWLMLAVLFCCVGWLVGCCGCRPCPVLLVFPVAWLFQPPKKVEPPNKRRKNVTNNGVLRNTIDGSEIRQTHQLSLVVYPLIYKVFLHPRWLFGISEASTVARNFCLTISIMNNRLAIRSHFTDHSKR